MSDLIKWKSIRQLRWTPDKFNQVFQYAENGTLPADVGSNAVKKCKFRKKFKDFVVHLDPTTGKKTLALAIRRPEDVYWSVGGDGKILFDVQLPYLMRVIPDAEKFTVLEEEWPLLMENSYRSVETFFEKLSKKYIGIARTDVEKFIQSVELHLIRKPAIESVVKPIITTHVNERWQIDLVDMSAYASQNRQTTFLLTVIDCFSKMAWVRPLKKKLGALVAYELEQLFLQVGAPQLLQSDNGKEFVNDDVKTLLTRFKVKSLHPLPYNPKANGQIERFNGTIKRMLDNFMADHDTQKYLPALQYQVHAYNTSVHKTTKFAPMSVYFRRDVRIAGLPVASENIAPVAVDADAMDKIVADRIQKNADRMIDESRQTDAALLTQIDVGSKVRLSKASLHAGRKAHSSAINKRAAKAHVGWTKEIYYVNRIIGSPDDAKSRYFVSRVDNNEPYKDADGDRSFFRHQLYALDADLERKEPAVEGKEELKEIPRARELIQDIPEDAELDELEEVKDAEEKKVAEDEAKAIQERLAQEHKVLGKPADVARPKRGRRAGGDELKVIVDALEYRGTKRYTPWLVKYSDGSEKWISEAELRRTNPDLIARGAHKSS